MININNLSKVFDDGTRALNKINININDGTVFGLIGSNGSGKSTLMRILSGVYTPDGGEALIDGQVPFNNLAVKKQVFYVPDTPYFIHQATLYEMACFYKTVHPSFSDERFEYLSNIFPLNVQQRITNMSKGMQRQAALMLALSCMPKYLLLDEAFDGLDPVIRQVLKRLIADAIATQGTTTIIASHNLRELEDLCDHIGLLHKGDLLLDRTLDELKTTLHKTQIIFSADNIPDLRANFDVLSLHQQGSVFNAVLRGERGEIESKIRGLNPIFFEMLPPTLEEIFIYELQAVNYDYNIILH